MINISQCDESRFKSIVKDPYLYYQKKKRYIFVFNVHYPTISKIRQPCMKGIYVEKKINMI